MSARDHLDKLGVIGAAITALCCLGIPAVLSVVAALGLRFLINDAVLAPILVASLALVVWGLARGYYRHRNWLPVALGVAASIALLSASLAWPSRPVAYASIGVLVIASFANVVALRRSQRIADAPE
jgi:mercuric ion transport protein